MEEQTGEVSCENEKMRMRMLTALVATLTAISPGLAGPQVRIEKAQDLARACRGLERHGLDFGGGRINPKAMVPVTNELLICLGYMQAVQDFSVLTDKDGNRVLGACVPSDATLGQMVQTFIKYARAHPEAAKENTAGVVLQSLQNAFPCEHAAGHDRDRDVSR
jgi:hypothetical protein